MRKEKDASIQQAMHRYPYLRQYHNLSLHDVNMAVSQEMCDLAKNVLSELENKK